MTYEAELEFARTLLKPGTLYNDYEATVVYPGNVTKHFSFKPCYGFLKRCTNTEEKPLIFIVDHTHANKEWKYNEYHDWLINHSVFKDVFVIKDLAAIGKAGQIIDTRVYPPNVIAAALFSLRFQGTAWQKLNELGFKTYQSYVLSHYLNRDLHQSTHYTLGVFDYEVTVGPRWNQIINASKGIINEEEWSYKGERRGFAWRNTNKIWAPTSRTKVFKVHYDLPWNVVNGWRRFFSVDEVKERLDNLFGWN